MASYLLLRNNKESGPYSLEGLIQLGLKPYDLVWVEGRSAAWRYPSEVEDLKFYAPVVEEQPFDRFYKKPSELKAEEEKKQQSIEQTFAKAKKPHTEPEVQKVPEVIKAVAKDTEDETVIEEVQMPKKQVYVSMPANSGKTVFIKKKESVADTNVHAPANTLHGHVQNAYKKEEPVKKTEPVISTSHAPSYSELVSDYNSNAKSNTNAKTALPINEEPDDEYPLEKKYSQSLDDIKDKYVQTLNDRKKKNAQRKMMLNVGKKMLPFAAVLAIGILTGVWIMNKQTGNASVSKTQPAVNAVQEKGDANNTTTPVKPVSTDNGQESLSATQPANLPAGQIEKNAAATNGVDVNKTAEQNAPVTILNPKKNNKKESKTLTAAENNTALVQPKSVETDPVSGERNKVVRTGDADNTKTASGDTKQFSNALMKQVNVKSNDYKRGTFGGIHDLQLTVNNSSNYLLDNVLVELQFLKPNDQPLKTDNIRFSPVPPNGSLTLAIPATTRGVKIAYKIVHVESKSAGNDTAGLK